MLRVAAWIAGGSGLITAVQLVEGRGTSAATRRLREEAEVALRVELEKQELDAFPLAVAAPDLAVAAATVLQAWGVGPVCANTVLLNWYETAGDPEVSLWYARLLQRALRLKQNVVVLDSSQTE